VIVDVQPDGVPLRRAFAPDVRTLEQLDQIREELKETDPAERIWWAQWMCDPRPNEGALFGPPTYYDTIPTEAYRLAYGCDFSYTVGRSSDYSAFVHARVVGGRVYVIDVKLMKLDATLIETTARKMLSEYGYGVIFSYQSGPEIGVTTHLREQQIPIERMHARYNKATRALRTIKAWNAGQILVPRSAPWVQSFCSHVQSFTGHDDVVDDDIDALVSLYDGYTGTSVGSLGSVGKRRA
jgi:predicted phage terminase large subunit-like protein